MENNVCIGVGWLQHNWVTGLLRNSIFCSKLSYADEIIRRWGEKKSVLDLPREMIVLLRKVK